MGDKLVWVDLEMTGLDPKRDRIVEIAVLVTDSNLNVLDGSYEAVVHQDEALLEQMEPIVREMHTRSGLIDRIRASSVSVEQAEQGALEFVQKHCGPREAPLAGNSIATDRRFLIEYMPRFEAHLHYRMVDVSTIKELARRWYPAVDAFKKKEAHTAMSDISESIEELRYYRERIFIGADR